jgi:hypothetical protein
MIDRFVFNINGMITRIGIFLTILKEALLHKLLSYLSGLVDQAMFS